MFFTTFHVINLAVSAPMCSIARAVLQCNGCSPADVPVINKYSTALSFTPPIADLASPPHIIVTETADAGLLGEYMLPTLLHAAKVLASPSAVHPGRSTTLIPASAVVYAALVQHESLLRMSSANFFSSQLRSDEAYSCGKLPDGTSVLTPSFVGELRIVMLFCGFRTCPSVLHVLQPITSDALHQVMYEQLRKSCSGSPSSESGFRSMGQNCSARTLCSKNHTTQANVECSSSGCACCILVWWSMHLAPGISLTYVDEVTFSHDIHTTVSCAPSAVYWLTRGAVIPPGLPFIFSQKGKDRRPAGSKHCNPPSRWRSAKCNCFVTCTG